MLKNYLDCHNRMEKKRKSAGKDEAKRVDFIKKLYQKRSLG